MIEDPAPGVKSKASTKFTEKTAKLPAQAGLRKAKLYYSWSLGLI
jgi:hypothetical protein